MTNKFLKITTLFITTVFILEMIPLEAFAFSASYPIEIPQAWGERGSAPGNWGYICRWGVNPAGYEPDPEKAGAKEIFGDRPRGHTGGYHWLSEGYYEDGRASGPTVPTSATYFEAQQHQRQYTEYSLKIDWRGQMSQNALRTLIIPEIHLAALMGLGTEINVKPAPLKSV